MVIAVDASFLSQRNLKNYNNFIIECFNRLANTYPQHHFIYIHNKAIDTSLAIAKNITSVTISFSFKWPWAKYWWYAIKLPAVLKKYKASVIVSTQNQGVINTKTPQCLIVNDWYSPKISKYLKKADSIATSSHFSKTKMADTFKIDEKKITVVYYAVSPDFKPAGWEEKEAIKNKYTNGIDYFLCPSSFSDHTNFITVLKAFSKFKKWQKSSMQLLIAGSDKLNNEAFLKKLNTYKYKNDIKLLSNIPTKEMALITASAYAVVCVPVRDDFFAPVIEAMQCGVPVIASAIHAIPEIAGQAALYANANNVDEIASHIITIYKDENKRNTMIVDGLQQVQQYNWNNTTHLLWQCITNAIKIKDVPV